MPRPLRVFLCHASQDKPAVRKMYAYLKQHGIQPWLDREDLLPGQDWEIEIPKAIFNSDVILVCLSPNSVNKEGYVQKEIVFALDKAMEKPQGTIFIIPVKLEECSVPSRLSRYQWVDYYRPDGRKRLLMGLNVRATDLGEEVSPVILEDTRRVKPVSKPVAVDIEKQAAEETAAREKAERERLEREAAEKAERDRFEKEAAEKTERDRLEREATEKAERERLARVKAEKEKADREKAERERIARETQEKAAKQKVDTPLAKPAVEKKRESAIKLNTRRLGIGGIIFVSLLVVIFTGNYLIETLVPTQLIDPNVIATIDTTATQDAESTSAAVLAATNAQNTASAMQTLISLPTVTPTPGIGSTQVSKQDGMVMVFVPAGEFTMGSDAGSSDEQPVHQVNLDAFWIDKTKVTNAMYAKCVEDDKCTPPSSTKSYTHDPYYGNSEFDDYPVIYVDWDQANKYCAWAGRELPTEAQWEKAARGTDGRTYPWGDTFDGAVVNFCDVNCPFGHADKSSNDGYEDVAPVGNYADGTSVYGALDMAGNVWEWVSSLYQDYPYDATDGREDLSASGSRVLRGGSWNDIVSSVRSANRNWDDPTNADVNIGFRCSLSP